MEPVPAKAFSGRLIVLAVVVISIIVLLAPSVRVFVQQRQDLAALRTQIAGQQQTQSQLQTQLKRWDDPAYIKQQARDRIFLVMPGETRYLIKGADGFEQSTDTGSAAAQTDQPWVDALWSSVQRSATDK